MIFALVSVNFGEVMKYLLFLLLVSKKSCLKYIIYYPALFYNDF